MGIWNHIYKVIAAIVYVQAVMSLSITSKTITWNCLVEVNILGNTVRTYIKCCECFKRVYLFVLAWQSVYVSVLIKSWVYWLQYIGYCTFSTMPCDWYSAMGLSLMGMQGVPLPLGYS